MTKHIQFRTPNCPQLILYLLVVSCFFSCTSDPAKRPSPLAQDSVWFNGMKIKLEYSRPAVKDRLLFGEGPDYLEQYGQVWRTGANDASFITIDQPLKIDSVMLDSGSYSIFTIPDEKEWTVIFNREWKQWGSYNYQDSLDVIRLTVPIRSLDRKQERMRFYIRNDSLKFAWDTIGWAIYLSNLP